MGTLNGLSYAGSPTDLARGDHGRRGLPAEPAAGVVAEFFRLLGGRAAATFRKMASADVVAGQEGVVAVGMPFVRQEAGKIEVRRHREGRTFGGPHRAFRREHDHRRAELSYGGRSGDTITVFHEVATGGDAAARVSRSHLIHLSGGNCFVIDGIELEVLEADAESMRYRVIGRAT